MKAREFTINVPINIKINGDGDPEIDMPNANEPQPGQDELDPNPVMVPPLQQLSLIHISEPTRPY